MTDTHCHILYGLDDGSHGIEESIELIEAMKSIGFNNLILTPHYIKGSEYSANNELKESHLDKLKQALKDEERKPLKSMDKRDQEESKAKSTEAAEAAAAAAAMRQRELEKAFSSRKE